MPRGWVREHAVIGGEQAGRRREGRGVHRGPDEHHEGAAAAYLAVPVRPGDPGRCRG